MNKFDLKKNWWVVVVVAGVVGIGLLVISEKWFPAYQMIGSALGLGLIGASFCWAYSTDRERLWWSIIPGLGVFALLLGILPDLFFGTDSKYDWINVLVMGLGVVVIAWFLKRKGAKQVLIIVSMFFFLVGFLMAPFNLIQKIILVIADILVAVFFLWKSRTLPEK